MTLLWQRTGKGRMKSADISILKLGERRKANLMRTLSSKPYPSNKQLIERIVQ
jgi:hypothetical protein